MPLALALPRSLSAAPGHGRAAAEHEHRVAELVAVLLLPLDAAPRVLQVLGHPVELAPELLVVGEARRGGQEADALGGAPLRLGAVGDRGDQFFAELLVARERQREVLARGRLLLHGLCLGASQHPSPFFEVTGLLPRGSGPKPIGSAVRVPALHGPCSECVRVGLRDPVRARLSGRAHTDRAERDLGYHRGRPCVLRRAQPADGRSSSRRPAHSPATTPPT